MKQLYTINASEVISFDNVSSLPIELLGEILNFLPLQELAQAFKVSKKFRTAITTLESPAWKIFGNAQNFNQFIERARQVSNGLLQALCFRLREAFFLAHCPFTKLSSVAETEEVAVQQLFDMFKLAQLLPETQDTDELTQMHDINLTPARGRIQEAVFADSNDQFISTFVIEYPTLRGIKGNNNNNNRSINSNNAIMAVNMKVLPLVAIANETAPAAPKPTTSANMIEYVEAYETEIAALERDLINKTIQTNFVARGATFVCWEKCSFGLIHCTDVYKTTPNSTKISFALAKKASAAQNDQQSLWSCLEESKEKRFEYWFSPSSPLSV